MDGDKTHIPKNSIASLGLHSSCNPRSWVSDEAPVSATSVLSQKGDNYDQEVTVMFWSCKLKASHNA